MSTWNSMNHCRTGRVAHGRGFLLKVLAAVMMLALGSTQALSRENGRREVVFIDNLLVDHQTLVSGMGAGVEVQAIDGEADGLAQMARWARSHRGYDAIHVVSHGAPGEITLGAGTVDDFHLSRSEVRAELARIGQSLRSGGDLFLYGCRVAEGERGRAFVRKLAAATGAHVAASTDPTGAARLGGDWALEYATAMNSARPLAEPGYDALLASGTITFNTGDGTSFGGDGIVTDGEGGSADIGDIVIQVAAIDESNNILSAGGTITFHNAEWNASGIPEIVTWDDGLNGSTHGMVIKSSDGTNFKLTSFNFYDWGSWDGATWVVEGLEGGDSVATATLTGNTTTDYVAVNLGATFQNVDEVRIYRQDRAEEWIGLNDIVIADAAPPPTTTVTSASLSTDTGTSGTDWVTYIALQTISGTLSANLIAGEKVQVSFDSGNTWSDAASAVGTSTWSVSTTLSGSDFFVARVYNTTGAGPSTAHSYDLDQTGPTITFGALALSADTGASAADFITRTAAQTITGTLSAGLAFGDIVRGSVDAGNNWTDITGKVSGTSLSWDGATLSGSSDIYLAVWDLAGNGGTITNQAYTLDTTAPTVTSITRLTPAGSLTRADSLVFRVTFSEGVAGVTTGDLDPSGTTAGATGVAAGSASQYDVTVSGGDLAALDALVSLAFAGGHDITDVAGNALTNTTPLGANQNYVLDNTAPGSAVGSLSVAENAANGTAVGTVSATDVHAVVYSLTDAAGGRFAISAGGAVTVADGSLLDYEAATSHSITIRATDAAGNFSDTTRTVSITNANDMRPVISEGAGPLAMTMSEDGAFGPLSLHATDADTPTDNLTWSISSVASHGAAAASGTGGVRGVSYVPYSNWSGNDSFVVRVSDGAWTDTITVTVTVNPVNDAPIINEGDSTTLATLVNTNATLTLHGTEVEGEAITWSISTPASHGTASASGTGTSKEISYTPEADYSGSDSFVVSATDGALTDTITVNVSIAAPTATSPAITPDGGTFRREVTVTLTTATPGATIRYTTDGSTPTSTHGTEVASGTAIVLRKSVHLEAIACKTGFTDSPVAEADFTIRGGGGAFGFAGLATLALFAVRRRLRALFG